MKEVHSYSSTAGLGQAKFERRVRADGVYLDARQKLCG
jgi:hypothetical protein